MLTLPYRNIYGPFENYLPEKAHKYYGKACNPHFLSNPLPILQPQACHTAKLSGVVRN
jgi:hypothetical protein